ncbi:hypothetical protein EVAR_4608_1 [Eumeta japonica]|uniref:Uncharacterized protein n=1 Tax=Eumeta variegata TaxID=151549 RepID=A0A4C1SYX6_EUMVA|nr:hypothetical protein EVAR_4608_1 [Eumeta japonica]
MAVGPAPPYVTCCKLKTRRHHGSTRKKFGRPEQLVDEVLKEVKVMSRLTDSGREINDFAITTRNCVARSSGGQADRTSRLSGEEAELAAVYAGRRRLVKRERTRIAERAPRRRETFKVNTQTEVTAKCPKCASEHKLAALHNKTHPRAYCRAKGCAKCNRGHHTLLHPSTGSDARPARAAPNESAVSETVTNIGTVRGPNGVERDIQCRTITRLDLPSQSLTADEISSHHHLNECHLEALRDARPLLLIGQDNWDSSPAATSGVENQVSQSRL